MGCKTLTQSINVCTVKPVCCLMKLMTASFHNGSGVGTCNQVDQWFSCWLGWSGVTRCSHPYVPATRQFSLVLVNGQWCCAAGKVAVGLTSVSALQTGSLTTYRLKVYERETSTLPVLQVPPPPQPFYGPFSGTTRVSWCQKTTSGIYGARED